MATFSRANLLQGIIRYRRPPFTPSFWDPGNNLHWDHVLAPLKQSTPSVDLRADRNERHAFAIFGSSDPDGLGVAAERYLQEFLRKSGY